MRNQLELKKQKMPKNVTQDSPPPTPDNLLTCDYEATCSIMNKTNEFQESRKCGFVPVSSSEGSDDDEEEPKSQKPKTEDVLSGEIKAGLVALGVLKPDDSTDTSTDISSPRGLQHLEILAVELGDVIVRTEAGDIFVLTPASSTHQPSRYTVQEEEQASEAVRTTATTSAIQEEEQASEAVRTRATPVVPASKM